MKLTFALKHQRRITQEHPERESAYRLERTRGPNRLDFKKYYSYCVSIECRYYSPWPDPDSKTLEIMDRDPAPGIKSTRGAPYSDVAPHVSTCSLPGRILPLLFVEIHSQHLDRPGPDRPAPAAHGTTCFLRGTAASKYLQPPTTASRPCRLLSFPLVCSNWMHATIGVAPIVY